MHANVQIQPVVSAGNVAQLAADLLISTLGLVHIGTFDPTDLVPAVGARDDGPGVSTPLERMLPIIIHVRSTPANSADSI